MTTTVGNLPSATSIATTDYIPVEQGGVLKKATPNLLPFIQSGTGAISTQTVQDKLRQYLALSDFDTQGNYNTAKALLTGTLAFPNVEVIGTATFSSTATLSPANASVTLSPTGSGSVTINPATAGTLNNIAIGGSTPLAGAFTTLSSTGNTSFSGSITLVLKGPDGTSALPAFTFASATGSGMSWSASAGVIISSLGSAAMSFAGTEMRVTSAANLGWGSGGVGGANDTSLSRDTTGTLALKSGNSAMTFREYAGNGGFAAIVSFNESLTIAAAATTDSSTTIPAGAIILAASVRVTTVIPTAATFTVTAATGGTAFNTAAVSTAATSTDAGTAAGALYTSAGTKIRITPNLSPGAATGVVRICGYYILPTPPTS